MTNENIYTMLYCIQLALTTPPISQYTDIQNYCWLVCGTPLFCHRRSALDNQYRILFALNYGTQSAHASGATAGTYNLQYHYLEVQVQFKKKNRLSFNNSFVSCPFHSKCFSQ